MAVTVETGARLHLGFRNLSREFEYLFGSLGVALSEPRVVVSAEPATGVECEHDTAEQYVERAVSLLDVEGARVRVESELPRHAGLGSGTQLALATVTAVARAQDLDAPVRDLAPALGRGRRSGIGVATFERGGFVLDRGRPTEDVACEDAEEWTVPAVEGRWDVPSDWRFLLVRPDARPGKSGSDEERSIQSAIERAEPAVSDRIEATISRRILPGIEENRIVPFGIGISTIDLLNGSWFVDEQGDVYRHPVDAIIRELGASASVFGTGQSSWGPAVYGVTDVDHEEAALDAGRRALVRAGVDGRVSVVQARNHGVMIDGNESRCNDR